MNSDPSLNAQQIDALKEISSIGMAHAATALSQMLGKPVYLNVPTTAVVPRDKMDSLLGDPEQVVVAVHLQILGKVRGSILLVFPIEGVFPILSSLLPGNDERGPLLTELQLSSLKEVGNILASAFLNALGAFLQMTLIPSVPKLCFDRAGVVVGHLLANENSHSVVAETEFHAGDRQIVGHLFLLPDQVSFQEIFLSFGVHQS
jgi:chemotaxis protein CheC